MASNVWMDGGWKVERTDKVFSPLVVGRGIYDGFRFNQTELAIFYLMYLSVRVFQIISIQIILLFAETLDEGKSFQLGTVQGQK